MKEIRIKGTSFSPPDVGELEATQVKKALESGWITTGSKTKELETGCSILWSKSFGMPWFIDSMCRNDVKSSWSDSSIIWTTKR